MRVFVKLPQNHGKSQLGISLIALLFVASQTQACPYGVSYGYSSAYLAYPTVSYAAVYAPPVVAYQAPVALAAPVCPAVAAGYAESYAAPAVGYGVSGYSAGFASSYGVGYGGFGFSNYGGYGFGRRTFVFNRGFGFGGFRGVGFGGFRSRGFGFGGFNRFGLGGGLVNVNVGNVGFGRRAGFFRR